MIRRYATPLGTAEARFSEAGLESLRLADGPSDAMPLDALGQELVAYFAGDLRTFSMALAPQGTEFQQRVWAALRRIPYGATTTYGEIARELGDPKLTRAVGAANGANPIWIVVPCHRVLGANGHLTGYAGGIEVKRWLLDFEWEHAHSERNV